VSCGIEIGLAVLYGVETRTPAQALKRNPPRFPDDFMSQELAAMEARVGLERGVGQDLEITFCDLKARQGFRPPCVRQIPPNARRGVGRSLDGFRSRTR
jgi:hypothetical protein